MVKAFGIDPKEIRKIATKMGIPEDVPLPYVTVRDLKGDRVAHIGRLERKERKEYPAGCAISIAPKSLESITESAYILGKEATDHIGHELQHYMQWRKTPTLWRSGREMAIDTEIATELDAELRSGQTEYAPSMIIVYVVLQVAEGRGLSVEDSLKRTKRIARKMGVSEGLLNRAERILIDKGKIKKIVTDKGTRSLTEEVEDTPERRRAPLVWEEVPVEGHERGTPSGGTTWVRTHTRRTLKKRD